MEVQVLSSDTCQTMGDVMREVDAAALVKGYFILMGVNSIANINFAALLDQHKQVYFELFSINDNKKKSIECISCLSSHATKLTQGLNFSLYVGDRLAICQYLVC